jgi:predicted peptidase
MKNISMIVLVVALAWTVRYPILGEESQPIASTNSAADTSNQKASAPPAADSTVPQVQTFHREITRNFTGDYFVYLPDDYGKDPNVKWPVVLFLHGHGQWIKYGLPMPKHMVEKYPFILIAPQLPYPAWWDTDDLGAFLDEMEEKYAIDKDRVCVSGVSMGGFGAWAMAVAYPDRFASVMPMGGSEISSFAPDLAKLPLWVFHGGKDQAVGIGGDIAMVAALKEQGSNVRFTIYPNSGHFVWPMAWNTPEVYEWMLAQRRGKPPVKEVPDPGVPPDPPISFPSNGIATDLLSPLQTLKYDRSVTRKVAGSYYVYLPIDYGKDKSVKWPVVLDIPPHDASGTDYGLPKMIAEGNQFPFIVVSPVCAWDKEFNNLNSTYMVDTLGGLLDEVAEKYFVDPDRVYTIGAKDGGSATTELATYYPNRFAAIVSIGGGSYTGDRPTNFAQLPIWFFAGDSPRQYEDLIIELRGYGNDNIRFTAYPQGSKDSYQQAYNTPDLFDWLLKQKRLPPPTSPPVAGTPKGPPVTMETSSMTLTNAEVVPQDGATDGKIVKFAEGGAAEGKVHLAPGGYEVEGWLQTPTTADGVKLEIEGHRTTLQTREALKLSVSVPWQTIHFLVTDEHDVTVKLSNAKAGVLIDRLVFKPLY